VNEQLRRLVAAGVGAGHVPGTHGDGPAGGESLTADEWVDVVRRLVVVVNEDAATCTTLARLMHAAAGVATAVTEGLDGRPVSGEGGGGGGAGRALLATCPWVAPALAPPSPAGGLLHRLHRAGAPDLTPRQVAALRHAAAAAGLHPVLEAEAAALPPGAVREGGEAGAGSLRQLRARVADHAASVAGAACSGQ